MKLLKHTLFVVAVFLCVNSFAQINVGFKVGANYNFNEFKSDSLNFKLDNAISFQGGSFVRVKIKKIHLQVEGLFTGRKGEIFNVTGGAGSQKINFYSFDMPLIIGYKLIDLKLAKLRLNLGVVPSFNMAKRGDLELLNYKDSFYSVMGGISLDIPLFLFDIRYQGAIGDYYQLQEVDQNTKLLNSLLTLSVALKVL